MSKKTTEFNCKKEGCTGIVVISEENFVIFGRRGCGGCSPRLYLCDKCGKLHEEDGTSAQNRSGDPFFCINGQIGAEQKDGSMLFF